MEPALLDAVLGAERDVPRDFQIDGDRWRHHVTNDDGMRVRDDVGATPLHARDRSRFPCAVLRRTNSREQTTRLRRARFGDTRTAAPPPLGVRGRVR
jgi:hypothetical protein